MKKKLQSSFNPRQYMVSKDFELYYYCDKNMGEVKNHTHDYYEIYFYVGGNVSVTIEETTYMVSKGDMLVIPPHKKHRLNIIDTNETYQRIIFWITQEYLEDLMSLSVDYGYVAARAKEAHTYLYHFDLMRFHSIWDKVFTLLEEMHSQHFGRETALTLGVENLLLAINRGVYEEEHPASPREALTLSQNISRYIEEHIDEELSLDQLAQEFYVSKYHIAHIFKENFGLSIHQYILKKRLSISQAEILNGTEITQVYLMVGFKDYSNFYKAFKKEFGLSPKEYRELYLPSPKLSHDL